MPGIKFKKVKPSQFEQLKEAAGESIVKADTYIGDDGTVYFLTEEEFDFKSEQVEKEEKICYNNNENERVYPNSRLTVWD